MSTSPQTQGYETEITAHKEGTLPPCCRQPGQTPANPRRKWFIAAGIVVGVIVLA